MTCSSVTPPSVPAQGSTALRAAMVARIWILAPGTNPAERGSGSCRRAGAPPGARRSVLGRPADGGRAGALKVLRGGSSARPGAGSAVDDPVHFGTDPFLGEQV